MKKVDFFVVGAMKAGTSSLHALLNEHPKISTGRVKEYGFFYESKFEETAMGAYHANFDVHKNLWGEICPNYSKRTAFEGVAKRISSYNPSAKIIYIRRNPIERALSETRHFLEEGEVNSNSLINWHKNHRSRHWKKRNPDKVKLIRFGDFDKNQIVQNSRYEFQLDAYREFFTEDQILSIEFENLLEKPQETLSRVLNHIQPGLTGTESFKIPHAHKTSKKLVPTNALMFARERSKYLDYKHWIFRFPVLKQLLFSVGLLRPLRPCFFDENLEISLALYLKRNP